MLPKMAFTGFTSRYREPKISEGFEDITSVDFKVSALSAIVSLEPSLRCQPCSTHDRKRHARICCCNAMHPCITIEARISCPANVGAQL